VIKTGSGTVKIGIDAPNEVRVMRGELLEAAAGGTPDSSQATNWVYGGVQSDQFPHVV
jgi:sRNA-binding carbon storage regulator CsrA